jgi:hypothetical protein
VHGAALPVGVGAACGVRQEDDGSTGSVSDSWKSQGFTLLFSSPCFFPNFSSILVFSR